MFDTISEAVSLKNFSPNEDLSLFYASVVRPATPFATQTSYERFPNLTFTCPVDRIPVVLDLNYKAENCNLDLGSSFRFPCVGSANTCIRTDIQQFVRSCFTPDPVTPPDFLGNLERYSMSTNYICFDNINQNLSVLGELISYPSSSTSNPTVGNPQGGGTLKFESGLKLPIGQFAAAYPDQLTAGFDTVFYIEEASEPNDICFSELWQTTVVGDLPPDYYFVCIHMLMPLHVELCVSWGLLTPTIGLVPATRVTIFSTPTFERVDPMLSCRSTLPLGCCARAAVEINLWDWLGRFCVCVINPFNLSGEGGRAADQPSV